MGLFSATQRSKIDSIAAKSTEAIAATTAPKVNSKSINDELNAASKLVLEYFKDSEAELVTSKEQLHEYVTKAIEIGYVGYDTETTGLDRIRDTIVGCSLYFPGGVEVYIPSKHRVPIFETLYKGQLTYEEVGDELQRLVDAKTKMILANADFDIAMTYKDYKVDIAPVVYYDVILAWRCLREDEKDNALKTLYAKYVEKGKVNPMKFRDFFSPKLFPYCKPEIAKLYAANDAKITYKLFVWQLPYVTKDNEKCKKHHLERIADLIWNIEMPMIRVCASLHRTGIYMDKSIQNVLHERYEAKLAADRAELAKIVDEIIAEKDVANNRKRPFRNGAEFNPNSNKHVPYLFKNMLGLDLPSTGKDELKATGLPVANAILRVRNDIKLIGTYVDKMPNSTAMDGRIHPTFKSVGADTGRMASSDPNAQNIPSKSHDIRHMFRATTEDELVMQSEVDDGDALEFVVDNGYQLYTPDGLKFVGSIQVGDTILLEEEGKEVFLSVKEIQNEGPQTRICYDV